MLHGQGGHGPGPGPRRRSRRRGRQPTGGGPPAASSQHGRPPAAPPQGIASLEVAGVLHVAAAGHGFLRSPSADFNAQPEDAIVPREIVARLGLETGVELEGLAVPSARPGQSPWLQEVRAIQGGAPSLGDPLAGQLDYDPKTGVVRSPTFPDL